MIVKRISFLLGLIIFLAPVFGKDNMNLDKRLNPLLKFASEVVANNRMIKVLSHDLTSATLQKQMELAKFAPDFSVGYGSNKSENSIYNSVTGFEDGYSTTSIQAHSGIGQRTALGDLSLEYSQSKTSYTNSQASYLRSMYFGLQSGLLRRDYKINALERRLAFIGYDIEEAQANSVLLDVLMNSFRHLFSEIIAARNSELKKRNLAFYSTLVEEAQIKLKNGMGSELDLKQAQMRYNQAETIQKEAALQLLDKDRTIGVLLSDMSWNKSIASFSLQNLVDLIPLKSDYEELIKTAHKNRPDMRILESQYKLQKAAYKISREKSRPNISAQLRWGKQGRGSDQSLAADMKDKNWDVTLSWTTKIGHRTEKIDYKLNYEKIKSLDLKVEQQKAEIEQSVSKAIDNLEYLRENLDSLRASEHLSSEVLEGQRLNFQLGKVTLLDISRYQQDFDNASLAIVRGEAQLIQSWLELMYETGVLCDFFKISSSVKSGNHYEIVPCKD